jgi:hypothetical protein
LRKAWLIGVLAVAGLAGCGSGGDSDEASGPPLSRERYVELERVYRSMLPIDRPGIVEDPTAMRRLARQVGRACARVDQDDPLLGAAVDGCEGSMLALAELAGIDCVTLAKCERHMRAVTATLDDIVAAGRESARTIRREVPDGACRDILVAEDSIDVLDRMSDATREAASAVAGGDQARFEQAAKDLAEAGQAEGAPGSAREELKRFRETCAPEAASS